MAVRGAACVAQLTAGSIQGGPMRDAPHHHDCTTPPDTSTGFSACRPDSQCRCR